MNRILKCFVIFMFIIGVCTSTGCKSNRAGVNKTRLANNKDDVKIDSINKLITISDRDYFVIYAYFRNNTEKELKNVKFYFELKDSNDKIIPDYGCFEIDSIPPGKRALGDYIVMNTDNCDVDKFKSITFTEFSHSGTSDNIKCSSEITIYKRNMRIEEMETR